MVETFLQTLVERSTYPRLLEWLLLEGYDPTELIDDFPLTHRMRDSIATHTDPADGGRRTQALLAFCIGWTTANRFIGDAAELTERHRDLDWAKRIAVSVALADAPEA